jgi:uncharacterized protein YidB (DUF937 family)
MGLFDSILGGIEAHDTQHAALYDEVGKLVNASGGVGGLTQQFEQQGLGGVISGWIGTGPNPAVSGAQVVQVIGADRVAAIAAKAGLTEQQVADGISKLLPLVVDHLTPNGAVPVHSPADVESALGDLKSKLQGA